MASFLSENIYKDSQELDDSLQLFEGPEKMLEVDWVPNIGNSTLGLRSISRKKWDELLSLAQCRILSAMSNQHVDSYVLSESSLFVFTHKMVIKTCGTTTLLRMLPSLLELTNTLNMELEWLGYMRTNFSFPGSQLYPHSDFVEEVHYLETKCNLTGEAHALGPLNADHWCAFVYDNCDRPMSESTDRTLNIMMYDVDPIVAKHFWKKNSTCNSSSNSSNSNNNSSKVVDAKSSEGDSKRGTMTMATTVDKASKMAADAATINSGIHNLLPSVSIQAHLFDPCGYSMNALLDDAYYTIHVTPETSCSYVSFETTFQMNDYSALVNNVLSKSHILFIVVVFVVIVVCYMLMREY
jgi:S-adenosylmethionine decarboxylase